MSTKYNIKALFSKMKKIGFIFVDLYRFISHVIQTLVLIPGIIFWGAVWFEIDMDVPHFNYKEFLGSEVFKTFLLISFMFSIVYFFFRKMEKLDEYSFKFGNSETGVVFDGGKSIGETVQKITDIIVENHELKKALNEKTTRSSQC